MEFVIIIGVILLICFIFGNADTKNGMLERVGLSLNETSYQNAKEREYVKYCTNVLKKAYNFAVFSSRNEMDVLNAINDVLNYALDRNAYYCNIKNEHNLWLGTSYRYYAEFASEIISRRMSALENGTAKEYKHPITSKSSYNSYVDYIWDKHASPWPDDWLKKEEFM